MFPVGPKIVKLGESVPYPILKEPSALLACKYAVLKLVDGLVVKYKDAVVPASVPVAFVTLSPTSPPALVY